MNTLKNTKFWIACATLVFQVGMFLLLLFVKPDLLTDTTIAFFIGGGVATIGTFGALNVVASNQASKEAVALAEVNKKPDV